MSLKKRLGRLRERAQEPADARQSSRSLEAVEPPAPDAPPPENGPDASPPVRVPSEAPEKGAVLEELRARMAAILGASAPSATPPRIAEPVDLPFLERETPHGPIWSERRILPISHHVGRIPVSAASSADAAILALLALDPGLSELETARLLYLDTETTGLGGASTLAFLIGLAWFDAQGRLVLEHLFVREPGYEVAVLEELRSRVEACSGLVSFNGKSFDWPLLLARCQMNRLRPLPERPHLDLLHMARRLHKRRLGKARLVQLEAEVLGWERGEDDISGAEIAPRYAHFLRSGDASGLLPVIQHNAWDVISMAALVGLYGEPAGLLHPADLTAAAGVALRAKAPTQAEIWALHAREASGDAEALAVLGRLEKARGDKAKALAYFEALAEEVDDAAVRLELAKLYEHHAKDYQAALNCLSLGTSENERQELARAARLRRKNAARPASPRSKKS